MILLLPCAGARWVWPWAVWLAILPMLLVLLPALARAGSGHDDGVAVSAGASTSPRVIATSERYQLVGIAEGEALVIYLDRAADNAPVTTAAIEITIDATVFRAELQKNGTYEIVTPLLMKPGSHQVLASIREDSTSDLLVGSITIPAPEAAGGTLHTVLDHLPSWARELFTRNGAVAVLGGLALVFSFVVLSWYRRAFGTTRRAKPPVAVLILVASLALAANSSDAKAHGDHDHGAAASVGGNGPHRRPDGMIFLPKPTQRLLDVRTWIAKLETAVPSRRFAGRVIANPNRSGVVQSTIQGRYIAPDGGVPPIGTRVVAGDLLGRVAPSFASIDASQIAQTMADLDQQIEIARARLTRLEPLLQSRAVPAAQVDEARINLAGLLKRRADLAAAKVQAEDLRSPVDGVIAGVRVTSGQVVSPSEHVFQIIDPSSLMVEALVFGLGSQEKLGIAAAQLANGQTVKLRYVGRSRALQQQYAQVQFEVLGDNASLDVGLPVKVVAETGAPVSGLIVPRAALTQAPNGETVVFRQKEPELFEPKPVRFEPFDADRVSLLAGVEPGETIVVQNAPLVAQVR